METNKVKAKTSPRSPLLRSRRPNQGQGAAREMDLFDMLGILRRQFLVIFLAVITGLGLSIYLFLGEPNIFSSKTVLYVTVKDSTAVTTGSSASLTRDIQAVVLVTQTMKILSDKVMTMVWDGLASDPAKRECVQFDFRVNPVRGIAFIRSRLSIKKGTEGDGRNANVLQITCTGKTPLEARVILDEVVTQFEAYIRESHSGMTKQVVDAIEFSRQELEESINASNEKLRDYIKNSPGTFLGDQTNNPLLSQLQAVGVNLIEVKFQAIKYGNRLKFVRERLNGLKPEDLADDEIIAILSTGAGDDPYVQTITTLAQGGRQDDMIVSTKISTAMNIELTKKTDLVLEMDRLRQQNIGDENPKMLSAKQALAEYENVKSNLGFDDTVEGINKIGMFTYPKLLETYVHVLEDRMDELGKQQAEMNAYIKDQGGEVRAINEYCQMIDSMKYSLEGSRELYNQLGRKIDDLTLIGNYGGYQFDVLVPPTENPHPISPNMTMYWAVGLGLGLAAGCGFAALLDLTDTTYRTPEEIEQSLCLPVLAQYPTFRGTKNRVDRTKKQAPGVPLPRLISYHLPNSPQCEVFRALRTKLFYNSDNVNYQVVQCTSPHPTDGKTMLLCNMAIKLADAGKKVLLIDGDLRKPDIHKWFSLTNTTGFSEILCGEKSFEEVVQPTAVNGLYLLTAGSRRRHPAELLTSENFETLLTKLRTIFDVILIDSPPMLYVSDPCIIASKVDGILYSVRIRRRGRPGAIQGVKMLSDVGGQVIGCIINCHEKHRFYNEFATPRGGGGGYGARYGGYNYGYGYGYGYRYGYGYGHTYGMKYGYGDGGADVPRDSHPVSPHPVPPQAGPSPTGPPQAGPVPTGSLQKPAGPSQADPSQTGPAQRT